MGIKRICALLLALCTLLNGSMAFAHSRKEHNKDLADVLFGSADGVHRKSDEFKMLHTATYLCLDQFNGQGEDAAGSNNNDNQGLGYLRKHGVSNLPKRIAEIDYTSNGDHRSATHRGWEHYYGENDKAHWPIRKEILLNTVEKVFNFSILPRKIFGITISDSEIGNSFAAILYYVHLLGDAKLATKDDVTPKVSAVMIPFAREHAYEQNPDIPYEMIKHFDILFASQRNSNSYSMFRSNLVNVASKARGLVGRGGIRTNEMAIEYNNYIDEFMKVLQDYVPKLLKKEAFFTKVFPL